MPNNWGLYGHTKKSIFRRISDKIDFHVPTTKIFWKFLTHERPNPTFVAKFEDKEPEFKDVMKTIKSIEFQGDSNTELSVTSPIPTEIVVHSNTIEMIPVKKEYGLSIPSFRLRRKEFQIPWIPKLEVKRKTWTVPLPKIKWRMPLLKKMALTGIIIIFPLLLLSAGFLVYTIKDMYDNGFVTEVMRYKIDEKIKTSEDRIQSQLNTIKETTDDLNARAGTIDRLQVKRVYRFYDVRGKRAYPSANQKAD